MPEVILDFSPKIGEESATSLDTSNDDVFDSTTKSGGDGNLKQVINHSWLVPSKVSSHHFIQESALKQEKPLLLLNKAETISTSVSSEENAHQCPAIVIDPNSTSSSISLKDIENESKQVCLPSIGDLPLIASTMKGPFLQLTEERIILDTKSVTFEEHLELNLSEEKLAKRLRFSHLSGTSDEQVE
jgi:hypothetical protein